MRRDSTKHLVSATLLPPILLLVGVAGQSAGGLEADAARESAELHEVQRLFHAAVGTTKEWRANLRSKRCRGGARFRCQMALVQAVAASGQIGAAASTAALAVADAGDDDERFEGYFAAFWLGLQSDSAPGADADSDGAFRLIPMHVRCVWRYWRHVSRA